MNILAYIFLLSKSIIYGSTPYFTGQLSASCDVLDILALRFLLSFFAMWTLKSLKIIKISVGIKDFVKKSDKNISLKNLLLAGLFEPVLYMFFETLGISMTSSVTTAVVISLSPIFYCVTEWLFFRAHPTVLQGIFLGLGIFGAIYIAANEGAKGGESSILGIMFLVLALVSASLFCVFSRKSSKNFSSFDITYISCVLGAVAFNSINVLRHLFNGDILNYFAPYFDLENLIGFLVLGIASTIIATSMNNYAIARVPLSTSAAFGGVSTFVTIFVGVVFGGEGIYFYHLIGFPFILARMIGVSAIGIMKDKKKLSLEKIK